VREPEVVRLIPGGATLPQLRQEAAGCTACDLHRLGTQTVFGEGDADCEVMLVGEQPGDKEDRSGRPFVGPAGQLLERGLVEAGIERHRVYVTNAVKHFKWVARGKRRIHEKPNQAEIAACRPWLDAEIAAVAPRVIVCLGATAAQALLGKDFRVTKRRGEFIPIPGGRVATATVHPSSILRSFDDASRKQEMEMFVEDLRRVSEWLSS
jgi:DNA polymerase